VLLLLAVLPSGRLTAFQCPDGAPPPCAGARPPDPQRIAILPFHVTSADTLLGEGVAELLATEFTGESGPRSVHMGTTLRAWRRAGGDLRTPLGQAQASRVARDIDAGRYIEGSVVGLGARLTLTASVVPTGGGSARRVAPVSGPADSLDLLVGRLAAGLLAASGAERGADAGVRLTDSPAAMNAYLAGLGAFRRLRLRDAIAAFERALDQDTMFARAAFMRYVAGTWISQAQAFAQAAWARRDRLSRQDRALLSADLGDRYPAPRSPTVHLEDVRRVASQLPESPEAHYLLGDYLYHAGAVVDVVDGFGEARAALERSAALDSQATTLRHLLEIGLRTADTALLLRVWPAYDRHVPPAASTPIGMVVAERAGDVALATELAGRSTTVCPGSIALWMESAGLTADLMLRLADRAAPACSAGTLNSVEYRVGSALLLGGRPRAAAAQRERALRPAEVDFALVMGALFSDGDSAAAALASARPGPPGSTGDSLMAVRVACARAQWQIRTGFVSLADTLLLRERGEGPCLVMLELWRAWQAGAPDLDARLAAADSLIRWTIAEFSRATLGYENLMLARVWEARGDLRRALSAVRLRSYGILHQWSEATGAREEGRLAALVGDTTAAVRAYRRYLDFRRDAEPALVPQRDSVRAAMGRLIRQ